MALQIFWTQKRSEDTHLIPQFQGAVSMRVPDPNQMFFPLWPLRWNRSIFKVKCRRPLNGAGLGFPNRRAKLFNFWFYNHRKNFHLSVSTVSRLAKWSSPISSGHSRKGKKKQHTWNKCQKLTFAFFIYLFTYFADESALVKMFPWNPKMMQEKYLLGASELLEATFSIKNPCTDLTEIARAKPWGMANRSHCAFEQSAAALTACFMCSWSSWLIRERVHVQNRRWLSRLEHIILLFFSSVSQFIPFSRVQFFSVVLLAFAACTVSTSSFTNSNSL